MSNNEIVNLNNFLCNFMNSNSQPKPLNEILLMNINKDILESAYKLKILQIKVGYIWEQVFIIFRGCEKLKQGADLINHEKKL